MDEIKKTPVGDGNIIPALTVLTFFIDEIKKTPVGDGNFYQLSFYFSFLNWDEIKKTLVGDGNTLVLLHFRKPVLMK